VLSFSLYVLVSFARNDARSNEGGLKYMLLGAFASALFLYGLSLIYGSAGTTFYSEISAAYAGGTESFDLALLMGLVLVLAGLGFKVAAVPFHSVDAGCLRRRSTSDNGLPLDDVKGRRFCAVASPLLRRLYPRHR